MIRAPRTASRLAGLVGLGAVLLVACLPATAGAANDRYVAMGDSYSSGTGTRDYFDSDCERSNFAYHRLLDGSLPGSPTAAVIACGGATTGNITGGGQHGNPGQGSDPALGSNTEYVTISIGGNDAGFSDVLVQCGLPFVSCDDDLDTAEDTIRNTLPGRLNNVYNLIRSRAPNARVTVVGYPRIFNGDDCNAATFFSSGEITRMNAMADLLADVTRAQAQAHGFGFADSRGAFLGHAVCDDPEWLNGLSNPTGESYHPNKLGHQNGFQGIVGAALLAQESPTVTRGPNGRIALTRGSDVYAMNGNGSFPVNLTAGVGGSATDPAWSPDGTRIAFAANEAGNYEIYVADWDGTDVQRLTTNAATDREPAWSPNGKFIAFSSTRTTAGDIYRMNANGTSQSQMTANSPAEEAPAWSPDGAEIAYQRGGQVWKMNADGQGQTQLTSSGTNAYPEYSPSGTQIAFQSNRDGDNEIFTMSATGGSQTQRTTNTAADERPAWSPNGASIVFNSNRDAGDVEIYTMTSTGGSQTRRTTSAGSDTSGSWQGDGLAPDTVIAAEPSGLINTATPSFTMSAPGEEGSTFECRVDDGTFSSCPSPFQTQPLSDGPHTFRARAIDPSGNVDGSPAERSFTVDTTPAETAITSGPSGPTNDATATFEFDAADPLTVFVCSVDGVPVSAPCVSPYTTAPLSDGPHEFEVAGNDGINIDRDSSQFVVDTAAPDTSLASGPGPVTNQVRPSFEISAEPGSTFECRIDGGAFAECTSPFAAEADLADGDHTFEARATDPAGNEETQPLLVSFKVDTVAPGAAIDAGPPAEATPPDPPTKTADGTPSFEFSSPDTSATFECRVDSLDESDWAACESPFDTPDLGDGSHTFEVRGVDAAGNAGEAASRRFVVDVTDPDTTITGGIAEGGATNGFGITFESSDPDATFECRIDSADEGDFERCESGAPLPGGLGQGSHVFEVRAVDQVGNHDDTPASRAFVYDTVDPVTSIDTAPPNPTNDNTPAFGFSGGSSYECSVDGADFGPCNSGAPLATLADGVHTFKVRALDQAGNRDQDPPSRQFRVDTVAPAVTITGPEATNDTTPTFALGSNEALGTAGFTCKVDSGTPAPCSSSFTTQVLSANEHKVTVTASDQAGNVGSSFKTFVVDLTPPNTTITSGPIGTISDSTPSFAFDGGAEPDPRFECRIDSGAYALCTSPWTTAPLADGTHTFEVRTLDRAGNADPSPAPRSFTVDTTAPEVSIDAGPREVTRELSHTFSFSAPGAARFECALDGGAFAACTSPYSTGPLGYGDHTFAVRATDAAGNQGQAATRTFTIVTPSNDFSIAKPKLNAKRGTADLFVTVPDPGKLELKGSGLKPVTKAVSKPGTVKMRVTPTGAAAGKLRDAGALKVTAQVTFTPEGGDPKTKSKRLKLRRK